MSKATLKLTDMSAVPTPPADTRTLGFDLDGILKYKDDTGTLHSVGVTPTILESQTTYVDATYGDDDTAQTHNADKPFATLNAAAGASSWGDTIVVRKGNYTATGSLAANGVNWYFMRDAVVTGAVSLFDDGSVAMTFSVYGFLKSQVSVNPLNINGAGSIVYFEFDTITGAGTGIFTGTGTSNSTKVTVVGNSITANTYAMSIRGGVDFKAHIKYFMTSTNTTLNLRNMLAGCKMYIECPDVYNTGAGLLTESFSVSNLTTASFEIYFKGNLRATNVTTSGFDFCCVVVGGTVTIEGNITTNSKPAIFTNNSTYAGKLRIIGDIVQLGTTRETITHGADLISLIIENGKITAAGYSDMIHVGYPVYFGQGNTSVSLQLRNCILKSVGSYNVIKEGSATQLIAYNTIFISATESIRSASAQNIACFGCFASQALGGSITELYPGGVVVDPSVASLD